MYFSELLRIASMPFLDSVIINETTSIDKRGYFYEDSVAEIICKRLRFRCEAVAPADREWGIPLSDGNGTGMVGMLLRNEADMIISQLSITEERMEAMDYSYPYYIDRMVFTTRKLSRSSHGDSFLKPFSLEVWLSLIGCVLMLPLICYVFLNRRQKWNHLKNAYEHLFIKSISPVSAVEFILIASWKVSESLLIWSYSAVLLSFLTYPFLTGVRNIPELAKAALEGRYQCISYPGHYLAEHLLSSDDSNFRSIGQSVKDNEFYFSNYHFEFYAVLANYKQYRNPAYIGSEAQLKGTRSKYFVSHDGFLLDYLGVGIRRDFCCKTQLDSVVHDIWASGIYLKLFEDFNREETNKILWRPPGGRKEDEGRPLSLADFQGVFILLLIGYFCATAVFLFEVITGKLRIK